MPRFRSRPGDIRTTGTFQGPDNRTEALASGWKDHFPALPPGHVRALVEVRRNTTTNRVDWTTVDRAGEFQAVASRSTR